MARKSVKFNEFNPETDNWDNYLDRLNYCFEANGIHSESVKKANFFTVCGSQVFETCLALITPRKSSEVTFSEIETILTKHYSPKPNEISMSYKFYKRDQQEGERASDYIAELRKISSNCNFTDLERMLRDRLVCGMSDRRLQYDLLKKDNLSYQDVVDAVLSAESAGRDVRMIQTGSVGATVPSAFAASAATSDEPTSQPAPEPMDINAVQMKSNMRLCYRCGDRHGGVCRFVNTICRFCKKRGHIEKVCITKKRNGNKDCNFMEDDGDTYIGGIYNVTATHRVPPYEVGLTLNGMPVIMQVDSGASFSLVNERTWFALQAGPAPPRLRTPPHALRTWTDAPVALHGQARLRVQYKDTTCVLNVFVAKGNGPNLLGRDCTVNQATESDTYPMPTANEVFAIIAGGKYFSTLDLNRAYTQVMVDEDTAKLLTLNTCKGLYTVHRLAFGVKASPGIFQRLMTALLAGVKGVAVLIDDIIVSGRTMIEMHQRLDIVLTLIKNAGLRLNKNKCKLAREKVEFLGYVIDADGIHPAPSKVDAIMNTPEPKNIQELQAFLGLYNFYERFIPHKATTLEPLHRLLDKSHTWQWTDKEQSSFDKAKRLLSFDVTLVHYDLNKPLVLTCDSSEYGVGVVLSHVMEDGLERPIAMGSRTLHVHERRYSQLDKEAASIMFGIKKFHNYLIGRSFIIVTDHKPLLGIFDPKKPMPGMLSPRLTRIAIALSAHSYEITYRPGSQIGNADGLSRWPKPEPIPPEQDFGEVLLMAEATLDFPFSAEEIAKQTKKDKILAQVIHHMQCGWPTKVRDSNLRTYWLHRMELSLEEDCLLLGSRVVIPPALREATLKVLHSTHNGIVQTKALARSYVWWPQLNEDVEKLIGDCSNCLQNRHMPPKTTHEWITPTRPWSRLHVDFAGPFQGRNFLIFVDSYSRWPEVFIVNNTNSATVIKYLRMLFATHGLCEVLVSDNGTQLISEEMNTFLNANNIKHVTTAPYHPATNGLAERMVQTVKDKLRKMSDIPWDIRIPNMLLGLRATPCSSTNKSPAELLMNRRLRTLLDTIHPKNISNKKVEQQVEVNAQTKHRESNVGQKVIYRNYGSGPRWMSGTVINKKGPSSYEVETKDGLVVNRHIDQLIKIAESSRGGEGEVAIDQNMELNEGDERDRANQEQESIIEIPSSDQWADMRRRGRTSRAMQGAASAPAPPAAEPPSSQQIKTEEVITQAKIETDKDMEKMVERQEIRATRTTSIDSDNRSDRSEDDDMRRARKRAASKSPCPLRLDKRITRFECPKCGQRFDSANTFDIHRFTAHGEDTRSGFDDLTFVDFSSKKFPEIAGLCERNPRISISEQRYRCDICSRDFPCRQTLDIHKKSCAGSTRIPTPERDRREDFFAKLDLRNRSFGIPETLTPPMERFPPKYDDAHLTNGMRHIDAARDLADIQSILNVTSAGSLLERLTGTRVPLESAVLTPPDTITKEREQEETQDNFAAEFRRMKLRGEFPCRLCPAKFPNLRALKGHNRVHLSGTGPGPYQCNMCPHASLDKAALVRHMRTHNGDRPYECAICNYAFTTKANCERHLRNRHAKVTREDVKRSIIYHPSEDPNNDEVNSKLARDEVKRSLAFHTPEIERRNETTGRDTPLTHFTPNYIADRHPVQSLTSKLSEAPLPLRENEQPLPRIKVKGIGQLTQIPEYRPPEPTFKHNDIQTDNYDEEAPVDLSTSDNNSCDVLDLSKKKRDTDNEAKPSPQSPFERDPSIAASALDKTRLLTWATAQQRILESALPKIDPAFYATQLSQLYAGTVPGLPGLPLPPAFPINPYFLQPSFFTQPTDSQELVEMKQRIQKEIIRGLSMSGGRLVANDQDSQPKQEPEEEDQKPLPQTVSPLPSPQSESPRPLSNSIVPQSDSVKMVIKNGVLMPKQKQRRYRTERPFSCSQCSARFTLRSNMERHVKQQHPQHWSVRRPTTRAPPPYSTPDSLADRVKYALLARHLERPLQQPERSPIRRDSDEVADNEEDEDDALVIDEEPDSDIKSDERSAAHRAAAEILMASRQQELNKDFDLKIAGNLINKPPVLPESSDPGTDPIHVSGQESLPIPVVPTRSDEEEDEEGLVASTSEGNNSGSDENKSESDTGNQPPKKKSAYSLAPNRVSCPYCHRKFPWSSSLRRHVLTHTGQKPFKCPHCPLLFTTKSNCDRHLLRKHGGSARAILAEPIPDTVSQAQPTNDVRTVPERPFKCASCPTSTFSSMETLKKHMSSRHAAGESQPGSPNPEINEDISDGGLVFKCHLCEASFGDRGGALNHLASAHSSEYDQLVSKGALDAASDRSESADDDERGKFPDHANRKVVCAFCVRRFWSAEDLRRHMRTHSGERPFACDLCHRKFTLKHSMLRHRKKHRDEITDDEEASPPNTPIDPDNMTNGYRYQDDDGSGNEIPSNVNNNNSPPSVPYEKKLKLDMTSRKYSSEVENDCENGSDLIGKLLGIPDKTIINKLLSSADEAAKFLGVNK
ncbi:LOW QUALITY PROTEIN: uncharacterized protein ACR2FA_004568 [Aphomia sociella]